MSHITGIHWMIMLGILISRIWTREFCSWFLAVPSLLCFGLKLSCINLPAGSLSVFWKKYPAQCQHQGILPGHDKPDSPQTPYSRILVRAGRYNRSERICSTSWKSGKVHQTEKKIWSRGPALEPRYAHLIINFSPRARACPAEI